MHYEEYGPSRLAFLSRDGRRADGRHQGGSKDVRRDRNGNFSIKRFKGLGEMNPSELWETTMSPENRVLKRIEIRDALEADEVFSTLMGSDVAQRRDFIWENSDKITTLDI